MDNQPLITPEGQPQPAQQPSLQPAPAPQMPTYQAASQIKQGGGKGKTVLIVILLILLLGGGGSLGYVYKTTNDKLKTQSQKLAESYKTIEEFQKIIDSEEAKKDFIANNNTAELSRSLCGGKAVQMSDVYLNDKFAVFRYLCANYSAPIRVGALKKLSSGGYEFTYGDGTANTNRLPSYIYDTDKEFFAQYGVTRF